jgi:hypothetical protein
VTGSRARSARSDSDDNRLVRTYSDSDNPAQMLISLATDQFARGPQRSAATEVPLTIDAKASGGIVLRTRGRGTCEGIVDTQGSRV